MKNAHRMWEVIRENPTGITLECYCFLTSLFSLYFMLAGEKVVIPVSNYMLCVTNVRSYKNLILTSEKRNTCCV